MLNFKASIQNLTFKAFKNCVHECLNKVAKVTDPILGKNFIPMIKYACYLVEHKTYVFQAGIRTKAPILNLIFHDMGKFNPRQLSAYARKYYNPHPYAKSDWALKAHKAAEMRHKRGNLHHIANPKWITTVPAHDPGKYMRQMEPKHLREALADVAAVYKHKNGKFPFYSKLDDEKLMQFFQQNLYHRMMPDNQELFLQIYQEAVKSKNQMTFLQIFNSVRHNLMSNRPL